MVICCVFGLLVFVFVFVWYLCLCVVVVVFILIRYLFVSQIVFFSKGAQPFDGMSMGLETAQTRRSSHLCWRYWKIFCFVIFMVFRFCLYLFLSFWGNFFFVFVCLRFRFFKECVVVSTRAAVWVEWQMTITLRARVRPKKNWRPVTSIMKAERRRKDGFGEAKTNKKRKKKEKKRGEINRKIDK
jgi:hypothetical protein